MHPCSRHGWADVHVQVYVRAYADGPTRVLVFSDDHFVGSAEQESGLMHLVARLQQVCVHSCRFVR